MKRNRVLAAILAFAMVIMMTPQIAFESYAATSTAVAITDTVGGQPRSVDGSANASGNGWSWDAGTGKLTLSGFNGESIMATGSVELVLNGTNTITLGDDDTTIYGIYAKDGSVTISSRNNSQSDQLTIKKENISPANYTYYNAIYATDGVEINGGNVQVRYTEASGNTQGFVPSSISPGNGDNRVSGAASVDIDIQCPNQCGRGFIRNLHAETSGDISVNIDGAASVTECAIDYIYASGTGNITASYPNANATYGQIRLSAGAGNITLNGRISLRDSEQLNYFQLPTGYAFTETSGDCGFVMKTVNAGGTYSNRQPVLCKADGTEVKHAVIKNVGVANAPLKFLDSANFDITGAKVGEGYRGEYFNGFVTGGTEPYTYTASGLPEGLSLARTSTSSYYRNYGNYIVGTPSKACPAGNATITVTDSAGASKSITIHYDAIAVPPRYLKVGGTTINMNQDASGAGWTYKAATSTITLDNYNGGPIISEDEFNIVLRENNVINMPAAPASGESSVYGIQTSKGNITIAAHENYPSSKLVIKGDINASTYSYYTAIDASENVTINSGIVQIQISETSGSDRSSISGIGPRNGYLYVNGSASLDVGIQCPNSDVNGVIRTLYANTSSDINVSIDARPAYSYSAIDYLEASGSGKITASYPNGCAMDGQLRIKGDIGDIELDGMISLYNRDQLNYFSLPDGYAITGVSGDYGFREVVVNPGESYEIVKPVLCRPDGTMIKHAVIKNVGVANAPLKFTDSDSFDISGARVGTAYSGDYFNGFVTGGVLPYTYTAEGLPAGLSIARSSTSNYFGNYIYGTPTEACDEGEATITVTDAAGTKKTITIHYDAIFSGAAVTGIAFTDPSMAEVTMQDGEKAYFAANVLPSTASDRNVSWNLSHYDCGYVTANKNTAEFNATAPGVVKLTARAFGGYKAVSTITVKEKTPDIKYYVTGADAAVLQGFDYNGTYEIKAGSYTLPVSDAYYVAITPEMRGKTISITKLNDNPACNSAPQQLAIPSTFVQTSLTDYINAHSGCINVDNGSYEYTGSEIIKDASITGLTEGVDYTVDYSYRTNVNVGTAKVIFYGAGAYVGTYEVNSFSITPKPASKLTINTSNATYTGSALTPLVTVYDGTKKLSEGTDYSVSYSNNVNAGTGTVTITGKGNYGRTATADFTISQKTITSAEISGISTTYTYTGSAITPAPTVKLDGVTLVKDVDYSVEYSNNTELGMAKVTVIGKGNYKGTASAHFTIEEPAEEGLSRIAGASRYDTALDSADKLLGLQKKDKFDTIIVACGSNFPDALTGSYLASEKKAPIILVDKSVEPKIEKYIGDNLATGGHVYILGGTGAVSAGFENKLVGRYGKGHVKRLSGANRYATNIAILKEAGVTNQDILICTGNGYADSLSASAAGLPILLVGDQLTSEQVTYLKGLASTKAIAIGGKGVVTEKVMSEISKKIHIDTSGRIAGASRYETSVAVAERFFGKDCKKAVLAYAQNFPDGLSGGPVAMAMDAPLLLVSNNSYSAAKKYCNNAGCKRIIVLGGETLISDKVANSMMN